PTLWLSEPHGLSSLSLPDALPIYVVDLPADPALQLPTPAALTPAPSSCGRPAATACSAQEQARRGLAVSKAREYWTFLTRAIHGSEEHTSELQSRENLVCRLLLEQ